MGLPFTIRRSRTKANSLVSSFLAGVVYRQKDEISYRARTKDCHVVSKSKPRSFDPMYDTR